MRVLFWMDSLAGETPGGHRIQIEQTMSHLEDLGVKTSLTVTPPADLTGIDIVHGYGLKAADVRYCRSQRRELPVVISTIYWSYEYNYPDASLSVFSGLRKIGRKAKLAFAMMRSALRDEDKRFCLQWISYQYNLRAVFEAADLLLPNAHAEAALIESELGVTTPQRVVVNGANHRLFNVEGRPAESGYVLYCGRFEPHKNQLGLIRAMRGSNIPVLLVGPEHTDHPEYYARCKQEASENRNIRILPPVDHEQLIGLYQGAKVHAMPSFFETTGLVSLEAALCGCNVVAGDRGYAREYLGDEAWWCDPYNTDTIRSAVESAFNAPLNPRLRERILSRFTWEHAARQTHDAYIDLLRGTISRPDACDKNDGKIKLKGSALLKSSSLSA